MTDRHTDKARDLALRVTGLPLSEMADAIAAALSEERDAALEEAARACDRTQDAYERHDHTDRASAAETCAMTIRWMTRPGWTSTEIRALKSKP